MIWIEIVNAVYIDYKMRNGLHSKFSSLSMINHSDEAMSDTGAASAIF